MSKTILIVWEHGGNLGHLARLLPIALALQNAQYKVVLAIEERNAATRVLDLAGFSVAKVPVVARPVKAYTSAPINHAELLLRTGFRDVEAAKSCVEQWFELFDSVKPAAVLIDASPLGLYAARSAGIPALVLGHGFEIPPRRSQRPCFMPWDEEGPEKSEAFEVELEHALQQLARILGRTKESPPTSIDQLYLAGPIALCTWPELDHFSRSGNEIAHSNDYVGRFGQSPGRQSRMLGWTEAVRRCFVI